MKKTTLTVIAIVAAVSVAVMQLSLVTVGHSGGGSTMLVVRHQHPSFEKFNFFESDEHVCAKTVSRASCEQALASVIAEHGQFKLPYVDAIKSLSYLND